MTKVVNQSRTRVMDAALRERARSVIPGGMYGHLSANALPPEYPQFYQRSQGAHVWDVDGNEYVDLMCSFGPVILGHQHPKVERAVAAQLAEGDTQAGPAACMVEAAELLVDRVAHADWAMFAKNGTDATTICLMVARAATGRNKVLAAAGAYHGSAPWCTIRLDGVTPEDRANIGYYVYNDIASVEKAVAEAGGDVAAIIVSPFKHDAGFDQELVEPEFARQLRALCDRIGAALVIDEVRAGFRLNDGGSWEPIGVAPDLSAWSKAIGNGYPLAAALGSASYSEAASRIFVTGSFWFQACPMAAAIATITAIREEGAIPTMVHIGTLLRAGIERQAADAGLPIRQTGPVQMPNLKFEDDDDFARARVFSGAAAAHGVILHPRHNWFISAAHTEHDVDRILAATWEGFRAVRKQLGGS
ncbi:MAG TPA: aminotransferase class III-fold pyridoxal phosphate-dependent enzyme [Streptosporangiaceae bacterium]|nr:aminotransferase class III-fold pyridoxal phosphate-dependent enzyme [Streptosporangiaceae bacterium]